MQLDYEAFALSKGQILISYELHPVLLCINDLLLILNVIYLDIAPAKLLSSPSEHWLDRMKPDTASLLAQIDSLGKNLSAGPQQDYVTRKQLRIAAENLYRALEGPADVVERVCFQVRNEIPLWCGFETPGSPKRPTSLWGLYYVTDIISIRIAINLKLFNILIRSVRLLKLAELATATSADPMLLGTLKSAIKIRYLDC